MQTFVKISLLTLCLGLASAEMRSADTDLMQFMLRSRDLSQENPTRSMACFDYYLPLLSDLTDEYQRNYGACLQSSVDSRSGVDDSVYPERKEMDNSAQISCQLLSNCNDHKDSISYFECYANAGSENTKSMYTISANSSEILAKIREEYRLIDNEEYRCTNASERVHVESSAQVYEEFQSCLQGKTPVPTTTQAPTTTSTTEGTTTGMPEEITTTAAPEETTTAAPEEITTAIPEETTAPQETTTAAPEETTTATSEETTTVIPEEPTTEAPEEDTTAEESSNGSGNGSGNGSESGDDSESESSSTENRMPEEDVFERPARRIKEALEKLRQQLRRN